MDHLKKRASCLVPGRFFCLFVLFLTLGYCNAILFIKNKSVKESFEYSDKKNLKL